MCSKIISCRQMYRYCYFILFYFILFYIILSYLFNLKLLPYTMLILAALGGGAPPGVSIEIATSPASPAAKTLLLLSSLSLLSRAFPSENFLSISCPASKYNVSEVSKLNWRAKKGAPSANISTRNKKSKDIFATHLHENYEPLSNHAVQLLKPYRLPYRCMDPEIFEMHTDYID